MRETTQSTEILEELRQPWILHAAGTRGSRPVSGRSYREFGGATSCYVLKRGTYAVVIDCGTGLYNAKGLLRDCAQIDVLLSHVHYDHILGLLDWSVFPRDASIRFLAPFALWNGAGTVRRFFEPPYWPYEPKTDMLFPIETDVPIPLREGLTARFQRSDHPNGGCLIRVESERWAVCYACDFEHRIPFPEEMGRGATILIYDAMFTEEEYPNYVGWGHSTWQKGCRLAKEMNVKTLLLAHHHPSRTDEELLDLEREAKKAFDAARFVRDGDIFGLADGKKIHIEMLHDSYDWEVLT